MATVVKGVDQYIKQYYGNTPEHFKDDLQRIIYMLHFVDPEVSTKEEIRNACVLLKELGEVVQE